MTEVIGFDVETTGLLPHVHTIRTMQFAWRDGQTSVHDVWNMSHEERADIRALLSSDALFVGHNLAFEWAFLLRSGWPVPRYCFDTMLAHTVLTAGQAARHGLDAVVAEYLCKEMDKSFQKVDWSGPLDAAMYAYAREDAEVVLELYPRMKKQLEDQSLWHIWEIERRALPAVAWLNSNGVPFDAARWRQIAAHNEAEKRKAEEALRGIADINWNSPAQVLRYFRGVGESLDNARESTIKGLVRPEVEDYLRFKQYAKLSGTYGDTWLAHAHGGRVFASYAQNFTATGRMSCSKPNFQNIPRATDPEHDLRQCFAAPPGRVLIKADYNAAELRIGAAIAGEETMLAAFREGVDVHSLTAAKIIGTPLDSVTKADRQMAKALGFGLIFGAGSERLRQYAKDAYGVELSIQEAAQRRAQWMNTYPAFPRWHKAQGQGEWVYERVRADGKMASVEKPKDCYTVLGRVRKEVEKYTERLNHPVQGTAADAIKLALARLWEEHEAHPGTLLVMCTHDEIVLECDADRAKVEGEWLRAVMVTAFNIAVQSDVTGITGEVELKVAPTWGG